MNCSDTLGRLDPYLDGELPMDDNVQVLRHIEVCTRCSSVFEGERLLFDEIRRQAAGGPAPVSLKERISAGLGNPASAQVRTAARPWPFARALVPAAAATVLIALFVTFLTRPVNANTLAQSAVAWHVSGAANVMPVSTRADLENYYGSKGKTACIHDRLVQTGMKYDYTSATVERTGPAGTPTCWWTATCPRTGCRMTHACFKAPAGIEEILPPGERKIIPVGGRIVHMNYRNGEVCLFVLENPAELERFKSALSAPRE